MFEFDPSKSTSNLEKHGLDFYDAQKIWDDSNCSVFPSKDSEQEPRFLAVGVLDGKHWTVIFTFRGENIRLISARRSQKKEVIFYDIRRTRRSI